MRCACYVQIWKSNFFSVIIRFASRTKHLCSPHGSTIFFVHFYCVCFPCLNFFLQIIDVIGYRAYSCALMWLLFFWFRIHKNLHMLRVEGSVVPFLVWTLLLSNEKRRFDYKIWLFLVEAGIEVSIFFCCSHVLCFHCFSFVCCGFSAALLVSQ